MAEDYWHARRRFLVPLLLLFSVCACAQRTSGTSGEYNNIKYTECWDIVICFVTLNISGCDQTFVSHEGPQNGTFRAPSLTNVDGESKVCVYTFMAASHQKVFVSFTKFNLRSTPPE